MPRSRAEEGEEILRRHENWLGSAHIRKPESHLGCSCRSMAEHRGYGSSGLAVSFVRQRQPKLLSCGTQGCPEVCSSYGGADYSSVVAAAWCLTSCCSRRRCLRFATATPRLNAGVGPQGESRKRFRVARLRRALRQALVMFFWRAACHGSLVRRDTWQESYRAGLSGCLGFRALPASSPPGLL